MLQKSARFALAAVLALSLSPMAAFAADDNAEGADVPSNMVAQAEEAPVISGVTVDSATSTVTIAGQHFGAEQLTSELTAVAGGTVPGDPITLTVASWADEAITATYEGSLPGIIQITVRTEYGESSYTQFVAVGADVYESSLALPNDVLGESFAGALPSSGIIKGWGEYLYYLRETPLSDDGSAYAFSSFERYGVKTGKWETLDSLPEYLVYASGCIWEGNFLVSGVAYDVATGAPTNAQRIFLYNFELGYWAELDATDVPLGAGIVNLNGFLRLVGGANLNWGFTDDVFEYDTGSGIGERVASLAVPAFCPQLVVNQGQIFVYSYGDTIDQYNSTDVSVADAMRRLQVVDGDSATELTGILPDFAAATVPDGTRARSEAFGSLAAATEGLILVGPTSADGAADTYILSDWNWSGATFAAFPKRASDATLYGAAACIHDNKLYAAATSLLEPDHSVFRATGVSVPAVKSGDYSVWRRGSDEPLTISFTPDISRFDNEGVFVDGVPISNAFQYSAYSGSTVIDLWPSFLSGLSNGDHELLVFFDGFRKTDNANPDINVSNPGAQVLAHFSIEGKADKVAKDKSKGGSAKSSTTLAQTGDTLLLVPFVILAVGALAIGIYLVRRRMHDR